MEPSSLRPRAARLPRCFPGLLLLFAAVMATVATVAPAVESRYAGRPLADVLLELRELGLRIVFASNVVRPEMSVAAEPLASDPPALLDELLAPHGLVARAGPSGAIVVVPRPAAPSAAAADPVQVVLSGVFEEELVVTPSRIELLDGETTPSSGSPARRSSRSPTSATTSSAPSRCSPARRETTSRPRSTSAARVATRPRCGSTARSCSTSTTSRTTTTP